MNIKAHPQTGGYFIILYPWTFLPPFHEELRAESTLLLDIKLRRAWLSWQRISEAFNFILRFNLVNKDWECIYNFKKRIALQSFYHTDLAHAVEQFVICNIFKL